MTRREKAQAALEKVAEVLEGDDSAEVLADIARHRIILDLPSSQWSMSNRILTWLAGTQDARGYRQWEKVGRNVRKGAKSFSILAPRIVKDTDSDTGEVSSKCVGFLAIPVFRVEDTDGEPLPDAEPAELPPLFEVAARLGVDVGYSDTGEGTAGYAVSNGAGNGGRIVLGSHDPQVFWHELAHVAHRTFEPKKKGGQEADAEMIAETVAAVVSRMYGDTRYESTHVAYIRRYTDGEPKKALRVLARVEKVLDIIFSGVAVAAREGVAA